MIKELGLLIVGIVVLWGSAELLIRSLQVIAKRLRISDTFIGLTILSVGTTLPELGTHIASSMAILRGTDLSGIALGTNIGSNIFQITVILGIVALYMTVYSNKKFLDNDYLIMLASIALLFVFATNGRINRFEGFFLAACYIVYLWRRGNLEHFIQKIEHNKHKRWLFLHALVIPIGIAILYFSANIVVENAHKLAVLWNVSHSLIGVVIIGFGTALPELAAAIIALRRKSTGMSVGVLVGSNITNPLFGVGIGALISTYTVSDKILHFDMPVWFFVSVVALLFFWRKLKIEKREAALLILLYLIYAWVRIFYIK
ncbi:calcium/sodium antiporter [Candidatus Woesearchaeota archaeon]|nr:calcium/sodium antiporter [Candidatus Woesearchaeota archaeon]